MVPLRDMSVFIVLEYVKWAKEIEKRDTEDRSTYADSSNFNNLMKSSNLFQTKITCNK